MIGLVGAVKLAAAAGCLIGAWGAWKQLPEPKVRTMMRKCFHAGDLYLTIKVKKGERKVYPTIHRVSIYPDRMQVNFSLPHGLDPKEVAKHEWAFIQVFGDHIDIKGDSKHFTMTVYPKPIEQFDYVYDKFIENIDTHRLPIICGQGREQFVVYDMAEHPHLLIAGETGSGKSTQLRSILTFLMQRFPPDKLQFYMADLKMAEFHLFKGMPHVIKNETDEKRVHFMLQLVEAELKRRGELLNEYEEAHIDDLPADVILPYIIICIDEFALLKGNKKVMELVEDISSIGRALGVFLILSCLRPDREVMDGKLKQNLTVRMAFRAADGINSRIVLGAEGAETIKQSQKGLMLLKFDGYQLVQAPYLELKRAKAILEPLKEGKHALERQGNSKASRDVPGDEPGPDSDDSFSGTEEPDQANERRIEKVAQRRIHRGGHEPKKIPLLSEPELVD